VIHFPWNGQIPRLASGGVVAMTLHDVLPLAIPGYFATPEREGEYRLCVAADLERADVVITDSEYSKSEIIRCFLPRHEPEVVPLATSIGKWASEEGVEEKSPYFLYAGGYDARKGLVPLLQTFLVQRREGKVRSRLVLVGKVIPFSQEFRDLVGKGVELGWVEERGFVPEEELARLYRGALALLYPSQYEGFGLPPLEAMTLGCPVVTTRAMSLPEVCGDAAYYFDLQNLRTLAEAMIRIEASADGRRELAGRGRRQAARFSWENSANRFLQLIDIAREKE
jgi:glycosyltransferase involved in cell wall biosynthesis